MKPPSPLTIAKHLGTILRCLTVHYDYDHQIACPLARSSASQQDSKIPSPETPKPSNHLKPQRPPNAPARDSKKTHPTPDPPKTESAGPPAAGPRPGPRLPWAAPRAGASKSPAGFCGAEPWAPKFSEVRAESLAFGGGERVWKFRLFTYRGGARGELTLTCFTVALLLLLLQSVLPAFGKTWGSPITPGTATRASHCSHGTRPTDQT